MNNRLWCLVGALVMVLASLAGCAARGSDVSRGKGSGADVELILFLTADGFRTDYVDWYHPPAMERLIAGGARVQGARSVFPANTTPNMTSLATGAYPRTTGVANNNQYVAELDIIQGGPRAEGIRTIAGMLADAGWTPAAISHFVMQNRGIPEDLYFQVETYGYDVAAGANVADKAIELINEGRANFIAINFGFTDSIGHRHGPQSEETKAAVLAVDEAIGRIVATLERKGLLERTLIVMTADHGMTAIESKNASMEPAVALREAGFKVATSQQELAEDTEIVVLKGGVRLVYFRKALAPGQEQRVMAALSAIEGVEVLDRDRLRELNCHPQLSGDLIVHPLPGYTIEGAGGVGGQHGRFTEANPVLFFHGPGIRKGVVVERSENVDIVPTILKVVGVTPDATVDGRPIQGALAR